MVYPYFDPRLYGEKRYIRRAGNAVGAAYMILTGVSFFLSAAIGAIAALSGKNAEKIWDFLESGTGDLLFQAAASALMFTLPFLIPAAVCGYKISAIAEYKPPKKGLFLPLLGVGLGMCAVGEYAANACGAIFSVFGVTPAMPDFSYPRTPEGIALAVLSIAVVPALCEEFALRGVTLGILRPCGDGFAIIASAAIFGLMHGNLVQIPFAFIVGLGLGFIAVKSGSVWTAVAAHFINNLSSVIMEYATYRMPSAGQNAVYFLTETIFLLLGVIGLIAASRREKDLLKLEGGDFVTPPKRRAKLLASSPLMIVFFIIIAFETLLTQVIYG